MGTKDRAPDRSTGLFAGLFLDMSGFLEEFLLESSDVVQSGLGVLLAGDGKLILLLALHKQLKELRNVPGILLPFEARRPGPVPRAVIQILRVVVDRLDGALAAGGGEGVLRIG